MPISEVKGLKIRFDNGIERLFHTYDFISARPVKEGIWEITIRERFFVFFPGKPKTYCGLGSRWRNAEGHRPTIYEALYLCQCWMVLVKMKLRRDQHVFYENPLRM